MSLDFGAPDPSISVKPISLPSIPAEKPLLKVQYTIELVGQRTLTSESAKALLSGDWMAALGQPKIFVMAGSDTAWRLLRSDDPAGAYDSVLLAWDMVSTRGTLTGPSSQHLLNVSEDLAKQLARKAMPLPPPADVPKQVAAIEAVRESFDIGVNLSVVSPTGGFAERDIWSACTALGLVFGPTGLFEWRQEPWPTALLGVGPVGDIDRFSLGQVQRGVLHPAVDVGFHVPISPDPRRVLETALRVAGHLASRLGGLVLDENDEPLDKRREKDQYEHLEQALKAMARAGLTPGSAEAFHIFS